LKNNKEKVLILNAILLTFDEIFIMENVSKEQIQYCYRKGSNLKHMYFKFVPPIPEWATKFFNSNFRDEYYYVANYLISDNEPNPLGINKFDLYSIFGFRERFTLSLEEALAYNEGYDELVSDYEPLDHESCIYDNRVVVDIRNHLNKVTIKGVYKEFVNLQINNTACAYEYLLKYFRLIDNDNKIIKGEDGILGKRKNNG